MNLKRLKLGDESVKPAKACGHGRYMQNLKLSADNLGNVTIPTGRRKNVFTHGIIYVLCLNLWFEEYK